jgi:2-haloacid dehalogenase/putative hydrolase of the HAD superfamily
MLLPAVSHHGDLEAMVTGKPSTALAGPRPTWLTFDCYGTLIQWDEGLLAALDLILSRKDRQLERRQFITAYDRHEHRLEQEKPHRAFSDVTAVALELTMKELAVAPDKTDADTLLSSIGRMPPFPEVVAALGQLKEAGFRLAIISNADDSIIAGNVAQLGGHVDRVITAQQARAYKPSRRIFEHAWQTLGITKEAVVHICASPHLDLVAARDLEFRAIWIDRGTGRVPPPDYKPDAVASSLDKLPDFFRTAGWM